MPQSRQEIQAFIKSCEEIHILLAERKMLREDEIRIIKLCCDDLATKMRMCTRAD